jgi:hypothetical protein
MSRISKLRFCIYTRGDIVAKSTGIQQIILFTKELAMDSTRSALFAFSLAILFAGPVSADTLLMDNVQSSTQVAMPQRGMSMDAVRATFGTQVTEHAPVPTNEGPLHPPITRWDYDGYSVFFENSTVLHSVVTHAQTE